MVVLAGMPGWMDSTRQINRLISQHKRIKIINKYHFNRRLIMKVKCNKCNYVGDESKFPKDRDFFQKPYIASCPKCDNCQSPGDASMRMFGGKRPFSYVRESEPEIKGNKLSDALPTGTHRESEAS